MIELIQSIFSQFCCREHPLVFIRPKQITEPEIYQGDFDLLLSPEDIESFIAVIHRACSNNRHSFIVKHKRLNKLEVSIFTHDGQQHVQMDIWTELDVKAPGIRKGSAISFDQLLDTGYIVFDEQGKASLEADFAATYYLSHLLSKNKSLESSEVQKRLRYFQTLPGVKPDTLAILEKPNREAMLQANRKLQDLGLITFSLSHRLASILFRIKQDIRGKRKFIAVVGPDGVGKTTIIEILAISLNGKYYRFKKLFRKSIFYRLLFSLKKKTLDKKNGYELAKNQFDDQQYIKLFWIALLGGYLRGLTLNIGKLKIFDRYYPDLLVSGTRFLESEVKSHSTAKKLIRLCPSPMAYIQLDAPEEIILSRKTELSAEAIKHLRSDYFEIGYQLNSPLYIYINNSHSLDDIKTVLNQLTL